MELIYFLYRATIILSGITSERIIEAMVKVSRTYTWHIEVYCIQTLISSFNQTMCYNSIVMRSFISLITSLGALLVKFRIEIVGLSCKFRNHNRVILPRPQ